MKRTILAPLLSAFVLPGLGQVINRQVRKAVLFMASIFILFLGLVIKLVYDLNKVIFSLPVEVLEKNPHPFSIIARALSRRDKSLVIVLVLLLTALWVYSVWDAFSVARKSEKAGS
jgi:TM2 domain-containing membrane protein YozV